MSPAAAAGDRRPAILEAAVGVFLRYGYRKTSMDDLARAADLSRQGLYLHFPSKEELFGQAATWLAEQILTAARASLARDDLSIDERLIGAFTAMHAQGDGSQMSLEHMDEIVATAQQLIGPVLAAFDQTLLDELERAIASSGIVERWGDPRVSARALAQHLQAASHGLKHRAKTTTEYQDGIRLAVQLLCGPAASQPPARARIVSRP